MSRLKSSGELLNEVENRVNIDTCDGVDINLIRLKAARNNSSELNEGDNVGKDKNTDRTISIHWTSKKK